MAYHPLVSLCAYVYITQKRHCLDSSCTTPIHHTFMIAKKKGQNRFFQTNQSQQKSFKKIVSTVGDLITVLSRDNIIGSKTP